MVIRFQAIALATVLSFAGAWSEGSQTGSDENTLARIDRLEELLLELTPRVSSLDRSVLDLELPDSETRGLFAERIVVEDLAPWSAPKEGRERALVGVHAWPLHSKARSGSAEEVRLFRPFLDAVDFFTHAHFKIVRGRFLDSEETRYAMDARFDANARMKGGATASVEAKLELSWSKTEPSSWRIDLWRTRSFSYLETALPLFAESLDRALPDPAALKRARTSLQEEQILRLMRDPKAPRPHKYFQYQSLNRHPGLSVVDVDGDGWDDVYAMERIGKSLLLRNRGDATFEEAADRFGLAINGHTSSALFADFDNDGDADVFLGRTLARSQYLVNEGGKFVDRSADLVGSPLPFLVSSVSAADYDRDGLLDVYFSTYGIDLDLQEDFLPREVYREVARRWRSEGHLFRDRPGPPNVLLRNLGGGRFGVAPASESLAVYRNTFQSTWSDYDGDGDMDLYLANDFAPNNLLRNQGDGTFVDVTEETGTADIGFGMGASWGDYDGDGRHDLYVTNMYSTAGRRITEELGSMGGSLAPMARGNSLFRNLGERFERVSGLEPPALLVERGGWGWGTASSSTSTTTAFSTSTL
jgi:hypothetical protein